MIATIKCFLTHLADAIGAAELERYPTHSCGCVRIRHGACWLVQPCKMHEPGVLSAMGGKAD